MQLRNIRRLHEKMNGLVTKSHALPFYAKLESLNMSSDRARVLGVL